MGIYLKWRINFIGCDLNVSKCISYKESRYKLILK